MSQAMNLRCSACETVYAIDEKLAGKKLRCECGKFFIVPVAKSIPKSLSGNSPVPKQPLVTKPAGKKPAGKKPAAKKQAAQRQVAVQPTAKTEKRTVKQNPAASALPTPTIPPAVADPFGDSTVNDPLGVDPLSGSDTAATDPFDGGGGGMFDFDTPSSAAPLPNTSLDSPGGSFQIPQAGFTQPAGGSQAAAGAKPAPAQAAGGQFTSAYAPAKPAADVTPKKQRKPINMKPFLIAGGMLGGVVVAAGLIAAFIYWNSSPTFFATPEECFAEYQNATRTLYWEKQFNLLTPEVQDERIRMAAGAALPWCKNGPELVEMFGQHGLSDVPAAYRELETAQDDTPGNDSEAAEKKWKQMRENREKMDQQIVAGAPDKGLYYQDLLETIVVFEQRFESNGLYRVNATRKKKQGRDFVTKNKLQNVEVNGDAAVGHIIIQEGGEEKDFPIKFKKIGESWHYDTADSLDYLIQIEVRSQSMN